MTKKNELDNIIKQLSEFNINNIGPIFAYIVSNIEGFVYVYKSNAEIFRGAIKTNDDIIIREDITDCTILDGTNLKSNPLVKLKLIYFLENKHQNNLQPFKDYFYKTNFEYLNDFIDMVIEERYKKVKTQLSTTYEYNIDLTNEELMEIAIKFLQSRNVILEEPKLQRVQKKQ